MWSFPEDASRSDRAFLYRILEGVIRAGATTVNIADTVDYMTPELFHDLILGIRKNVPSIDEAVISAHCHNDLGMATAKSLTAIRAVARMLRYSFSRESEARAIEAAVKGTLAGGFRTADIFRHRPGERLVTTEERT